MIANRRELQTDPVQCLDRRLVVKERGQQRRCTDQITGCNHHVIPMTCLQCSHRPGQLIRTADCRSIAILVAVPEGTGRFEVPVVIIQGDQLDLDGCVLGRQRGARGQHDRDQTRHQTTAHNPKSTHSMHRAVVRP